MSIDKKRNSNSIFLTTVLAAFAVGACSESTTRMRSDDANFQWPKARLAAGPVETFVSCDEISEHVRSIVGVRSRGSGNHGRPSAAGAARATGGAQAAGGAIRRRAVPAAAHEGLQRHAREQGLPQVARKPA